MQLLCGGALACSLIHLIDVLIASCHWMCLMCLMCLVLNSKMSAHLRTELRELRALAAETGARARGTPRGRAQWSEDSSAFASYVLLLSLTRWRLTVIGLALIHWIVLVLFLFHEELSGRVHVRVH